jgi:hypothetical protein
MFYNNKYEAYNQNSLPEIELNITILPTCIINSIFKYMKCTISHRKNVFNVVLLVCYKESRTNSFWETMRELSSSSLGALVYKGWTYLYFKLLKNK